MPNSKFIKLLLISSLTITTNCALADKQETTLKEINAANTTTQTHTEYLSTQITHMTHSSFEKLSTEQQQSIASEWGLSTTDYSRYLWLMSNTSNSLYYADKNLDPTWILGMNAKNSQELEKYATIAVKNERNRIQKELAFQREFTRLAKELFPNEKPIDMSAAYDISTNK